MDDMGRIVAALEKQAENSVRSLALSEKIVELQKTNASNHARVLALQEEIAHGNIANHGQRIAELERAYKALDLVALEKSMVTTFTNALSGVTNGVSLADYVKRLVRSEMDDAGIGVAK